MTDPAAGARARLPAPSLDDLEAERAPGASTISRTAPCTTTTPRARRRSSVHCATASTPGRWRRRPSWARRAAVVGGLVAFAVAAGFALSFALGARLPGQTASGNTASFGRGIGERPSEGAPPRRGEGEPRRCAGPPAPCPVPRGQLRSPRRPEQYETLIRLDPSNAEAYAQSGRILYLTAAQAPAAQAADLVDSARARLDQAIELDPGLPDRAVLPCHHPGQRVRRLRRRPGRPPALSHRRTERDVR